MGLRDSLRAADARLVPRAAVWLRTALDRAADRRSSVRGAAEQRWRQLLDPTRPGLLRRLDERYARTGPLQLLRDVPQLGLLLVAMVFLAGAGVALARSGPETVEQREQLQQEEALPLTLGPPVGADVEDHLATARDRAVELARETPDARYLALLDVRDELTIAQTGSLLVESGLTVRKVYVRAPIDGDAEPLEVEPGEDVVRTLTALFAETATRKADEQREFLSLAESIEATSQGEKDFKASYEQAARTSGREAAAYRSGCACVLALVVEARAAELAELLSLPVLRGVEVAPRGTELNSLDIRPLSPDVTGIVPEPTPPAGG